MADNKTIYQKIGSTLNFDGFGFDDPKSNDNNKIIIRGDSPEDLQRKALELQQKQSLADKFFKVTDHGFQKAMQYEAARLPAYLDYEGMEYYPLIASSLDLFMEEATTIGENGKMLNIYSNNDRIKGSLDELFYDIINVNVNLPFWVRQLCKYGDNFVYLVGQKNKGLTFVKQLVNYEMERIERVEFGKPIVKFKQRETSDEFNVFEIAHFRLLGDDKYLPYGSSVLNKVRRVFRQLIMAEDAMLTYRILRAGEKRVFKIDVGNIDDDDIESYIHKIATRFKKQQQVYPDSGQIDYTFNILGNDEDYFLPVRNGNVQTGIDTLQGACLALDTKIELLDGRSLELKDIIKEYDEGKKLWSYSINPANGEIVPAPITWAGITRKNAQVLKLTLDNGKIITCTPDHKFPTKYGKYKEAKNLSVGESMWAFNKKDKKIKGGGKRNTYEMIYDHSKQEWVYTHRMVANYMKDNNLHENFKHKIDGEKETIHHKDFNRYNNNPENLCWMNSKDHLIYHQDSQKLMWESLNDETKESHKKARKLGLNNYWKNINADDLKLKIDIAKQNSLKSRDKAINTFNLNPHKDEIINLRGKSISKIKSIEENKIKQSNVAKKQWENTNLREIVKEKQSIKYSHKLLDLLIEYTNEYGRLDLILDKKINVDYSEWLDEFNSLNLGNKQLKKMSLITRNNIDKMLKHFGYSNWRDFKSKIPCYNHKIVNIEWLDDKQDTGTITIDGNEELHNYHNFALTSGIFTKNSNLDQIQDIEYLRDNLFTGLGIPKPFLGFQEAAGDGKNMAQMDIRFAKKVNRIQQAIIQELNKIAIIHLLLLGFKKEEIYDFEISLTNPSTQQDLLKTELWQQKAQVYSELTRSESGIAAMSHTAAKKFFFGWSDKDIVDDYLNQRMERAVAQELQDSPLIIKKTGLFSDIDKKYGIGDVPPEEMPEGGAGEGGMDDMGGGPEDLSGMGGGDFGSPADLPPVESKYIFTKDGQKRLVDSVIRDSFGKKYLSETEYITLLERLVKNGSSKDQIKEATKNIIINEDLNKKNNEYITKASNLVGEIDTMLGDGAETINTKPIENLRTYSEKNKGEDVIDFNIDDIDVEDV